MGQGVEHGFRQPFIVRFLWVETDAAIVTDTELARTEFLESQDGRKVIDIGAQIGARLTQPKWRFDHRHHAATGGQVLARAPSSHNHPSSAKSYARADR